MKPTFEIHTIPKEGAVVSIQGVKGAYTLRGPMNEEIAKGDSPRDLSDWALACGVKEVRWDFDLREILS